MAYTFGTSYKNVNRSIRCPKRRFSVPQGIFVYVFLLLCFILTATCAYAESQGKTEAAAADLTGLEPIKKNDRILVLAPHPDDETIACAGVLQNALRLGAEVRVVYLTNGDNNEVSFIVYEKRLTFRKGEFLYMGNVRRKEAINAMQLLGVDTQKLIFLGYPDFGTFSMFRYFWQRDKPYKSMLTRVCNVPYKNNLSYGEPYVGQSILRDLEYILTAYRPTKIFVSHPLDINADHKALYLFLEVALADVSNYLPRPKIYTYLIHWKGWPLPRNYHPELPWLPSEELSNSQLQWSKYELTPQELEKKYKAVLYYKSQTQISAFYLLAFARKNELFGCYPEINPGVNALAQEINPPEAHGSGAPVTNTHCCTYELAGDSLLIRISKRKSFGNRLNTMMYLFGYNYKIPFDQMPKIRIITRSKKFKIFDGKKKVDWKDTLITLRSDELIVKVPLTLLGDPDFVLVSVNSYSKEPCVDGLGFRKVNIRRR
jgi:LmbE family N-acetylglucosaminyl deacetylase